MLRHCFFSFFRKGAFSLTYDFTGFTPKANAALNAALTLASGRGHTYVGSEHLLLALCADPGGTAGAVMRSAGLTPEALGASLDTLMGRGLPTALTPEDVTPRLEKIVSGAVSLAGADRELAGTDHLLLSLLTEKKSAALTLLQRAGVSPATLRSGLASAMRGTLPGKPETPKTGGALGRYGTDLTDLARRGGLDPVEGREEELSRLVRILCRRTKNNPCLIGEPGVGKTAVVHGLALAIAENRVPPALAGKRLFSLDLNAMVAGAKYRGDFEERLRDVVRETVSSGDVILFVDEVHNLMGAGAAEGAVDAANILKPALAGGALRLIGATTSDEYLRSVAKDKALSRRFQTVPVPEATAEQTVSILRRLAPVYASHHGVTYTDDALEAAAALSKQFLPARFLPDKAIDLMDEAFAAASLSGGGAVDASGIREALTALSGAPDKSVVEGRTERLRFLERTLSETVFGQAEAVAAVAAAVRRAGAGLSDPKKPMGVFLFCGPTGVGKTLLAKTLAREVFGDEKAVLVTDMSAFAEAHASSALFGAPPGYVGYDDGETLVTRLKKRPFCVLLFDEIEKAHPDVLPELMRLMDEGVLTGRNGESADARHTIIIMTSNLGASGGRAPGFLASDVPGRREVAAFFPAEFLARVDETVFFRPLDEPALSRVVRAGLRTLSERAAARGVRLESDAEAVSLLARLALERREGARPVAGLLSSLVETPLADLLLGQTPVGSVRIGAQKGRIVLLSDETALRPPKKTPVLPSGAPENA